MLLIRRMEQKIESLFSQGLLRGTTHCCIGEEAVPVALSELIDIEKVQKNIAAIEAQLAVVQAQMKKYMEELGL